MLRRRLRKREPLIPDVQMRERSKIRQSPATRHLESWRGMAKQAGAQVWGFGNWKDYDGWGSFLTSGAREREGPQSDTQVEQRGRELDAGFAKVRPGFWQADVEDCCAWDCRNYLLASFSGPWAPSSWWFLSSNSFRNFPVTTWFKPFSDRPPHIKAGRLYAKIYTKAMGDYRCF